MQCSTPAVRRMAFLFHFFSCLPTKQKLGKTCCGSASRLAQLVGVLRLLKAGSRAGGSAASFANVPARREGEKPPQGKVSGAFRKRPSHPSLLPHSKGHQEGTCQPAAPFLEWRHTFFQASPPAGHLSSSGRGARAACREVTPLTRGASTARLTCSASHPRRDIYGAGASRPGGSARCGESATL